MVDAKILALIDKTPDAVLKSVAERVKLRRLEKKLTQKSLALKAGVTLASYRRFETTGEISFRSLLMISMALGMIEDFDSVFSTRIYSSMDELIEAKEACNRKRGVI